MIQHSEGGEKGRRPACSVGRLKKKSGGDDGIHMSQYPQQKQLIENSILPTYYRCYYRKIAKR
ncbi:MAG: hypothetical protein R6V25_11485 [Desulfatiglandales bacterium]